MHSNKTTDKQIASMLLEIKAIKLNLEKPFQWASGWHSPIYCDNRLSLSYPEVRNYIKDQLVEAVKMNFPRAEAVAGVATAGIPQGALLADALGLPFLYVRSKPKGHGMENLIEGRAVSGQKVIVVEDLISTGGSSLKAAEALQSSGVEVLGMLAIFSYAFDIAQNNFDKAGIKLHCLSNYHALIEEAVSLNYVSEDQVASLRAWRERPESWRA